MYIMCVCLFSALSRRVGAVQISIIIINSKNSDILVKHGTLNIIRLERGAVYRKQVCHPGQDKYRKRKQTRTMITCITETGVKQKL